jgi:abequosyltransferase
MMKFSFVIPTLNFAAFLPETLDSIVDERFDDIEIIVFDGGSTDDTLDVLEAYRSKWPALKVVSATERGNIDIDLNKGVAEATGDYIWTMSADDVLMPGWSGGVLAALADRPDLALIPAVHCDIKMRPRRNYPILREDSGAPLAMTLAGNDDLLRYLAQVRTSEGVFSFCSACIVRRDRLLAVSPLDAANGTCWRYSARLIAVLVNYPSSITVLGTPLIYKRGDNDSFASAGLIRRLKIATLNWDEAVDCLGLDRPISAAIATHAKADIRPATLLYLSQFVRNRDEKALYRACVASRLGNGGGNPGPLAALLRHLPPFAPLRAALNTAKAAVRVVQQRRWSEHLAAVEPESGALDRPQ